ncbi:MAG: choice-of-anchor U domain-containing protein [Panacagrimonas sp.]
MNPIPALSRLISRRRLPKRLCTPAAALIALALCLFAGIGQAAAPEARSTVAAWKASFCSTPLGQYLCDAPARPSAPAVATAAATTATTNAAAPASQRIVRDKRQRNVTFSTAKKQLTEVTLVAQPGVAPMTGVNYPSGFFRYNLTQVTRGATVVVTMTLPAGTTPNKIIRCNRRARATCLTLSSGVTVAGNTVRLTVRDGGVGDDDGAANGKITDLIAPVLTVDDGIADVREPTVDAGGADGWNLAALGPLAGATVTVAPLNMPQTVIAMATTNENGFFSLMPDPNADDPTGLGPEDSYFETQLLVVTVEGGMDIDANDDGVRDTTPTPNQGALKLLVLGSRLKTTSVSVSILSDMVYRTLESYLDTLPQRAIEQELERLAYALLKGDIDGNGAISYNDITAFNPTRAADKAKLEVNYADVLRKDDRGMSLVDKYHANAGSAISTAVRDLFGSFLNVDLPQVANLAVAGITINGGVGGLVTSPDLPIIQLGRGNRQFVHKAMKTDPSFVLEATPDPEFRFSRWVGCPEIQANNTCRVTPASVGSTAVITAQYMLDENTLAPGMSMEMALMPVPGKFGVTFRGTDELLLTVAAGNAADRAKLDAIAVNGVVQTGVMNRPQVKILAVNSRGPDPSGDFYRASFQVQDIDIADAYSQYSAQAPDRPVVMDDLLTVTYAADVAKADQAVEIKMPTQINKEYVEGPTPSGEIDAQGSCPSPSDEEVFTTEMDNGDPVIACIEEGAEPVASIADCEAGERTIEIIDGRLYCIAESGMRAAGPVGPIYKASLGNSPPRLIKTGGATKPATTHEAGRGKEKRTAREVFLVGYGRAFDLGGGTYITNAPDGTGLALLETDGKPEIPASPKDRKVAYRMTCNGNRHASGCGGGRLIKTQTMGFDDGFRLFGPQLGGSGSDGLSIELSPPNLEFLKVTVTVQVQIDNRVKIDVNYIKPLRAELSALGFMRVTPTLSLTIALTKEAKFTRTGAPTVPAPKPEGVKKTLVEIEFATAAVPASAFFKGAFDITVGIDLTGSVMITGKLKAPVTARIDGEGAFGWGCRTFREVTIIPETPLTPAVGLKIVPEDCTGETRDNFKGKIEVKYAFTATGSVNAVVEPYVEFGVSGGFRFLAERVVRVAVRGFVQGEILVEGPTIKITDIPEELSAQGNKTFCRDGVGGVSGNLYAGARGELTFSTADSAIGKIFRFDKKITLGEYKEKIASFGWDFVNEEGKVFPQKENIGFIHKGLKKDAEPCTSAGAMPKDEQGMPLLVRTFKAGQLDLQDNAYFATQTRQLVMQKDGNLVYYNYDGAMGMQGTPIFASDTSMVVNTRLTYQPDGNLVIYNILDNRAVWATGTQSNPGSVLRMQADGQLLMYKSEAADAIPIWGREVTQNAGRFSLNPGEFITSFDRKLVMQPDGNLVLYKFQQRGNQQLGALFSTRTNGNPGSYATFQTDGNLVVYNSMGRSIWATNTSGLVNATLKLQSDGNLVVIRDNGTTAFFTNTNGL